MHEDPCQGGIYERAGSVSSVLTQLGFSSSLGGLFSLLGEWFQCVAEDSHGGIEWLEGHLHRI